MVFFTIGMFYLFFSLTINLLVNELNLKDRNFIKNSPRLIKIVSYFEKTSVSHLCGTRVSLTSFYLLC